MSKVMTFLLRTFLLACFVTVLQSKVFGRCELAHLLKENGMDKFEDFDLADLICMAFYESGFDTLSIDEEKGGTKDYGIFHINSGLWCEERDSVETENRCNISCSSFLNSDIEDDIDCLKKIVKSTHRMDYWDEWAKNCEDEDLHKWIKGCKL